MQDEVISLQIGNYSNFIGSHLWNIKESLHDQECIEVGVSYHCDNNYTLSPRCVIVDLFENIGGYPTEVKVSDIDSSVWSGIVAKSVQPQDWSNSTDYWSDLSNVSL